MEDYKEKYEAVLNRVKDYFEGKTKLYSNVDETLKYLFPELKESEDERIRKALIRFFSKGAEYDSSTNGIKDRNIIAWLEKQGEKKQHLELKAGHWYFCHQAYCERADILTVKEGETFKCEKDGIVKGFIIKEPEKYFREISTPSDKVEPKFKVGDVIKNIDNGDTVKIEQILDNYYCYSGWDGAATIHSDFTISEQDNWELVEKKPTDKVEPKFKVKYAGNEYNVFEVRDIGGVTYYGIEDEPNHIDYVLPENCEIVSGYGVKEKGNPYPTKSEIFSKQKPVWSEDDERCENTLLWIVESYRKNGFNETHKQDADKSEKWLKSIKERYTWKPSDEQMHYLSWIVNIKLGDSVVEQEVSKHLNELLEDLKKLSGK